MAKTVAGTGPKQNKKRKKLVTGKSTPLARKVKAEERMTSETTPEKEATTLLEELLSADKNGEDKGLTAVKKNKKKTKVKFKSVMLREEAISYFEAIVAGLKRGSIQFRQGDETVELKPTPHSGSSILPFATRKKTGIRVSAPGWLWAWPGLLPVPPASSLTASRPRRCSSARDIFWNGCYPPYRSAPSSSCVVTGVAP